MKSLMEHHANIVKLNNYRESNLTEAKKPVVHLEV